MNEQVKQQVGDKAAIALWYSLVEAAGNSPWLASLLLKRAARLRRRLANFYDRLTQLPRRWRRRLHRRHRPPIGRSPNCSYV